MSKEETNGEQLEVLENLENWLEYYWNRFRKTKDEKYLKKFEMYREQAVKMSQFGVELKISTKIILQQYGLLFMTDPSSLYDLERV